MGPAVVIVMAPALDEDRSLEYGATFWSVSWWLVG